MRENFQSFYIEKFEELRDLHWMRSSEHLDFESSLTGWRKRYGRDKVTGYYFNVFQ
jgi:hypothetical protein